MGGLRSSWGGQVSQLTGGGQVQPGGGVRSSRGGQVQLGGVRSVSQLGGVRSSWGGGGSGPAGWGGQSVGGSASCTLLRAVCLLHSCRRTFLSTYSKHKTVLLRERKRHTARHVASPWGYLSWPRGGTYLGQGGYLPWWGKGGTYLGWGYLPWPRGTHPGQGIPPGCGQTNKLKLLPSPHPTDVGGKYLNLYVGTRDKSVAISNMV